MKVVDSYRQLAKGWKTYMAEEKRELDDNELEMVNGGGLRNAPESVAAQYIGRRTEIYYNWTVFDIERSHAGTITKVGLGSNACFTDRIAVYVTFDDFNGDGWYWADMIDHQFIYGSEDMSKGKDNMWFCE